MAQSVMQKIQELSRERERLVNREGMHHASAQDHARLEEIDHDLSVLWDLRRRELAGEKISLDEDYYDRYDRYTDEDAPGR
jgi:DNA-binding GntR family transcriptional regulator